MTAPVGLGVSVDVSAGFEKDEAWVRAIGERILPEKDCQLVAMVGRQATADTKEVRLIAYCGESYDTCGDGFYAFDVTGDDPLSKRDEAEVERIWRGCIEMSLRDAAGRP